MPISREDILRIATLARLDLTEDELARLENDLARILENIDVLSELSLDSIPPTAQVVPVVNVLRDDEPAEPLPIDQLERMAPEWEDDTYRVSPVFEE